MVSIVNVAQQFGLRQIDNIAMDDVEEVTFLHGRCHAGPIQEGAIAGTKIQQLVRTRTGVVVELEVILEWNRE